MTALRSAGFVAALVAGGLGLWMGISPSDAADHAEAPGAAADAAADIADYYAWHTDDETTVHIVTWASVLNQTEVPQFDDAVLVSLHQAFPEKTGEFADLDPDVSAHARFGTNSAGDWGVQVTITSPVGDIVISGPVGEPLVDEFGAGVTVWAGAADDPFFFDLQGYTDTITTGDLSFTGTDALAGANVTALVIEAPAFSPLMHTWATTARDTN
ncbi:MAG: DUF4331 domain-containing protein [Proteobacteria bacterium]|nr:DUF4331 domain-containing protein [Pseudomonadota bacterium]